MIKIFLVLILLSIFILLIVLLVKEAKEKSYDYDNIIFKIIDFIIEEDITIGILFVLIVLISIIVFGL
ncbi:MAG: hypothetical protein J1E81_07835 [Eubacterium sp.]|nr:hypothetical protein [Eubacterium sp.]